jgi:flagellar M-ring protein FliF
VLVSLVAAAAVLIPLFLVWASAPTYAVAFSGLSETDAGAIVENLSAANIPYQLRGTGTILVPSNQVYEVRLQMARQGLPEGGNVGYELFSGNTLGMTEFTQRVNYQRALEGELERTIGSLESIQAVRVHIVTPEKTLLAGDQAPTTASITIQENPSNRLDAAQVQAITHLVASSVEGLKPENVVVVDVNGNLLASGEATGESAIMAQTDSRHAAEMLAARDLQSKVEEILDQALGPNKSVVQATVSMDWTQRQTTTQSFDPADATVRSQQTVMETYTTTNATLAGVPGAVSNLPVEGSDVIPENQSMVYSRTEQTINYEITEMQSVETAAPGRIERISLSVLVDGVTDPGQLDSLTTVIAAAVGIDEGRGDLLAVETLAFDRSFYTAQAEELASGERTNQYIQIAQWAALVLGLAALLWYIYRLLTNLKLSSGQAWTPILRPVADMALTGGGSMSQAQLQPSHEGAAMPERMTSTAGGAAPSTEKAAELPARPSITLPKVEVQVMSQEEEQLIRFIEQMAESDPGSIAEIIQLWLSEDEKRNG